MSLLLPSELAKLASGGKTHAEAMKILQKENPDWPEGDLKDTVGSVSPSMTADARKVQKRYQELTKKASTESHMLLPSERARLGKFPAGVSMTIDEVAEVVGPEFKKMNVDPPAEVVKLREEMMDKAAAKRKMPAADMSLVVKGKFPNAYVQLSGLHGEGANEITAAVDGIAGFKDERAKVSDAEGAKALMEKAQKELVKNKSFKVALTTDVLDLPELTIKWVGKTAKFTEGPEGEKEFEVWMKKQPQAVQDDWKKHTEENRDKFKTARYEEGQPADPTAEMSPEDKAKWEGNTEKYKDKFTDEESMMDKYQEQLLPSESFSLMAAAKTRRRSTWKNAEVEDDIGKKVKGPEESDKDEPYMKGQFTQTENSELSTKAAAKKPSKELLKALSDAVGVFNVEGDTIQIHDPDTADKALSIVKKEFPKAKKLTDSSIKMAAQKIYGHLEWLE